MRAKLSAVWLTCVCVFAGSVPAYTAFAQTTENDAPAAAAPPILVLDQDRFFQESAWGKAAIAVAEKEAASLAAENRKIELALEEEERRLTERRAGMTATDFAAVSTAFDQKVEGIRNAQDAKSRAITTKLEADRQQFFQVATPVLGAILEETGAVAILADSAIILSRTSIDATDLAIARIDSVLPASGAATPVPDTPEPATDP